jgi:hypothetical protein
VTRLLRLVTIPALALAAAGCSTGHIAPPPQAAAPPSAAASTAPAADNGFPTSDDGPVLDAARSFVEQVTSYDHTKLADQRNAVLPLTGDPLKGELSASLADNGDFATTVTSNSRDAKGTVVDLGLVSREGDRAVVVLFVDQQITSPAVNQTQRLRERVTLNRSKAGVWLATKLETI